MDDGMDQDIGKNVRKEPDDLAFILDGNSRLGPWNKKQIKMMFLAGVIPKTAQIQTGDNQILNLHDFLTSKSINKLVGLTSEINSVLDPLRKQIQSPAFEQSITDDRPKFENSNIPSPEEWVEIKKTLNYFNEEEDQASISEDNSPVISKFGVILTAAITTVFLMFITDASQAIFRSIIKFFKHLL